MARINVQKKVSWVDKRKNEYGFMKKISKAVAETICSDVVFIFNNKQNLFIKNMVIARKKEIDWKEKK